MGSGSDPVAALDLLLGAGADPAAGYCWQRLTPPFTAPTGVLGSGEGGQPAHPDAHGLAERLLVAGADANEGQALGNRMLGAADDHLELLPAHGLGPGDGGRWRRRLPDLTDAPVDLLSTSRAGPWCTADWPASGCWPPTAPTSTGRSPVGSRWLRGAPRCGWRAGAAGRPGCADASPRTPGALPALREGATSLVPRAAVADQHDGVRLMARPGSDLDTRGRRQDPPLAEPWETALHPGAGEGKEDLVRMLLALGAGPAVTDHRFGARPVEWARHLGRAGPGPRPC